MSDKKTIKIIGIGPGDIEQMTGQAVEALASCDVIVGYDTYIDLVEPLLKDQEVLRAGMTEEVERARSAVERALKGQLAGIISSGDAGLYGMAGLVYEILEEAGLAPEETPEVEVIPGITAMLSCASLLGAPLMHDVCTISLSDHLTPWGTISERLHAAGKADFSIALYNPKSRRRKRQFEEAVNIIRQYREPSTPVGVVTSAYRKNQSVIVTTLGELLQQEVGMLTTVIIGNTTTKIFRGKMVTPRGYQRKYQLDSDEQKIKFSERLKKEHEPWAFDQAEHSESLKADFSTRQVSRSQNPGLLHEIIITPGHYEHAFNAKQIALLAGLAGETGELGYTPDHHVVLKTPFDAGEALEALEQSGLVARQATLMSSERLYLKVCDFCQGQRRGPHAHLDELFRRLELIPLPRELRIGYTGCGMSCYGAAMEDIAIIYSQERFEIYAGAKKTGKLTSAPLKIAEDLDAGAMIEEVEKLVARYSQLAQPGEKFYKFIERQKTVMEKL